MINPDYVDEKSGSGQETCACLARCEAVVPVGLLSSAFTTCVSSSRQRIPSCIFDPDSSPLTLTVSLPLFTMRGTRNTQTERLSIPATDLQTSLFLTSLLISTSDFLSRLSISPLGHESSQELTADPADSLDSRYLG